MAPKNNIDPDTLKTHLTMFFLNFQKREPMQVNNMAIALIGFCELFGSKTKKDVEKILLIMSNPVIYALDHYPTFFPTEEAKKMQIHKTLGTVDWIYFRDTALGRKLTKKYTTDAMKARMKEVTLEAFITILNITKLELYRILTKVARDNEVSIELLLPYVMEQQIKQAELHEPTRKK